MLVMVTIHDIIFYTVHLSCNLIQLWITSLGGHRIISACHNNLKTNK
jgi:hypothetical protein